MTVFLALNLLPLELVTPIMLNCVVYSRLRVMLYTQCFYRRTHVRCTRGGRPGAWGQPGESIGGGGGAARGADRRRRRRLGRRAGQ